jgi:hypothetical protein
MRYSLCTNPLGLPCGDVMQRHVVRQGAEERSRPEFTHWGIAQYANHLRHS